MYRLLSLSLYFIGLLLGACSGDGSNFGSLVPPGIENPTEITPDEIITIDTRGGSQKHLLNFKTSGKHEFGRYLSEYVLVIKSNTESCVRLKVRPAEEIGSPVTEDHFDNDDPGAGSCGSNNDAGGDIDSDNDQDEGNPPAKLALVPDAALAELPSTARPMRDAHWHYLNTMLASAEQMRITSSPQLCSLRIFRMPSKRINRGPGDHSGKEFYCLQNRTLTCCRPQQESTYLG